MKLSTFIKTNIELVITEWENFAKTIFIDIRTKKILRDHAKQILLAIAQDLEQSQSKLEQTAKSKGLQEHDHTKETAAEEHGFARMQEGFSITELAAEYRALRASVTKLWGNEKKTMLVSDITDLIRFNEAIDQSLNESIESYSLSKEKQARHFDTMLSSSPDLSFVIDSKGIFLYVNTAMSSLYQKPADEMVGKFIYDLEQHLAPEEQTRIQLVLDTGKPCRGDMVFKNPSGREYFFEYIYTPIFDENGKVEAIAGNSRDITERKIAEAKIWHSANYDILTGLPNRRLFRDRLDQSIKHTKRTKEPFALLFIDLDRFKNVNDELGHDAGDLLLKQAGDRIKDCVRETDTVARMGGDEFTVLLTQVGNAEHVKIVTEKILCELKPPFQINQQLVNISGSIGIAICPQDGVESDTLLGNADRAMYVAKKLGRTQISVHTSKNIEK